MFEDNSMDKIIKIRQDKNKSSSLKQMAVITYNRLQETDKEKYPTNTLTDYYDVMHKLMEAIASSEGIKIIGEGAHQQLIEYMAKNKHIDENTRIFLQEMRDFRNRISYEGFMISKNYIALNDGKIKSIIYLLLNKIE